MKAKLNITFDGGTPLQEAAQEAISIAKKFEMPVRFEYNGEFLTAREDDRPDDIVKQFEGMAKIKDFRVRPRPQPRRK